ncbi:hypothetical protein [Prosthecobacter sp.]|uniref:hypothetical protein n=1 Tax=Prosthecobacter sp. TaxID=1965333 RepID=UPI001D25D841|nr:hypothetical protein [Prosthecobacter sp.]MCB1278800.1 hypothetical protein [Prosthecobacter sp.]
MKFASLCLTTLFVLLTSARADDPTKGTHLLLDSRVIQSTQNARLTLGTVEKHPANPLMAEDRPWEVRFDNLYANVVLDPADKLYKCWYSPFIVDLPSKGLSIEQRHSTRYRPPPGREMGVCYAVSEDGLKWVKPELGVVEFEGSKANNLVLRGPHGAGVTCDDAEPDPQRRYKMFRAEDMRYSADGVHWSEAVASEDTGVRSDTHNNMVRGPDGKSWAGFVRLFNKSGGVRERVVGRTESADLKHWTKAVEVLRCDPENQAYAMPVFRHGDVYLGLLAVIRTKEDRVHTELAWSPDTATWQRIQAGTPFIGNATNEGDYDWGCVYAAASPVVNKDEIRIYYGGSNGKHTSWRDGFLCLATLRPDGWAGYEPVDDQSTAIITTRPVTCSGSRLWITCDAHDGGQVKVTAFDESGNVTGSAVVTRTGTRVPAGQLEPLLNRPVVLRMEIHNAKVYSFGFADAL